ncbi:MAG: hypothetical protein RLZZ435_1207 [Cyanobacteriota bacterium]
MSQSLYQKYQELNSVDRFIVQILSALYNPTHRPVIYKCFNAARQLGKLHPCTQTQIEDRIRKLLNLGLLVIESGGRLGCEDTLMEVVIRDAVKTGNFPAMVEGIQTTLLPLETRGRPGNLYPEVNLTRDLRIAIYQQDQESIDRLLAHRPGGPRLVSAAKYFHAKLCQILTHPFDLEWFQGLSPEFQDRGLEAMLEHSVENCLAPGQAFELLEERFEQGGVSERLGLVYLEQLWLQGYFEEAIAKLDLVPEGAQAKRRSAFLGAAAFLRGQAEEALGHYRQSLATVGKDQNAIIHWFARYPGNLLYFFAALKEGQPKTLKEAQKYAELLHVNSNIFASAMPLLLGVIYQQQGNPTKLPGGADRFYPYRLSGQGVPALLQMCCLYWLNIPQQDPRLMYQFAEHFKAASQAGYGWLAGEIAALLCCLGEEATFAEIAEVLRIPNAIPLNQTIRHQKVWEVSLTALSQLTAKPTPTETAQSSTYRMIWRIDLASPKSWTIAPLEQKLNSKGTWTKGKPIALKRLVSGDALQQFPYMTNHDRQVAQCIEMEYEHNYRYYGGKTSYTFNPKAILALVDHPHVYWEDSPNVRVEVVKGAPELLVKQVQNNKLHLELVPNVSRLEADQNLMAVKETPTRLKVIQVLSDHKRIAELLGSNNRLIVPLEAKERVLTAIAALSSLVTVQSDIGGGVAAEEVPSDATPRLHLLPAGEGLKVSILVHPFAEGGSYYPPGKGGATVIAEVEGKRLQTQRNLKEEKTRAKAIEAACEVLQQHPPTKGEWHIEDPADCLELLLQLQNLGDAVQIEWPQGEKFRVSRTLSFADFKLQIKSQQDWFTASGEVQVSDSEVLELQQLLSLLDTSPGRFIQLSDGQFLALTDEFRKRLQTLGRLSESTRKGLRVSRLAALSLEDVLADVDQLKVDQAWRNNLKRIKTAQQITPQVPDTLQATLRDYQVEGYHWLSRLAQWGVGACLADDMGLGKTIQVLTVILSRAEDGPTLVIAPTSVGMNWISESERFAPHLNVKPFGSGDRQKMLDETGPRDLVVCSYGLLQQDDVAEKLAKVQWNTIVLDEAQAIKNAATKRSQAAMALTGNFKVITTGTPIENHLGELWNLFRFINPGLLGSLESFNQRFAYAIERDQDAVARDALRRLIQPFILRRTKDQVLKELPSRTEITLQVELSAEEKIFYEALRRESLEKLANSDAHAGAKHLQVLAEIMRLRRACCNPRLVRPELSLPSAKLEQFSEVLQELLESGHKALVFSQFVDHLTILREYLEAQQISYQYLDGSTPTKQRKQRVDAFQNGEGDVFLISLKAGGTGLNLTAADYVIHMDPWWNPAVEDQASDRAHRIGQQRPVTIYRLVAQGTIEEKIVALHQTKRDLADSLLEGADMSGKISTEELLALLSQG